MIIDWLKSLLAGKRKHFDPPPYTPLFARKRPPSHVRKRTLKDLAKLLEVDAKSLEAFPISYKEFQVPKRGKPVLEYVPSEFLSRFKAIEVRSRNTRTICIPSPELKKLQRKILRRVLARLKSHDAAMAYERGRSIATHASRHSNKAVVVGIDLQDFFGATSAHRIEAFFIGIGWDNASAYTLTRLVTHKGSLPQGAPTSPRLANLVNYHMDARLTGLARWAGAEYSRYSDDLAFSFQHDHNRLVKAIANLVYGCVAEYGYTIHIKDKLFIRRAHQRQLITGLVVNNGPPRLSRETKRWLRAVEHRTSLGLNAQKKPTLNAMQLQGWWSFERMVDQEATKKNAS